ncbi:MAG: adenine deaminase [Methanobacteriota archaeon]|nr:MAG: adenine deaminase [Euryarchaeota archaeon]
MFRQSCYLWGKVFIIAECIFFVARDYRQILSHVRCSMGETAPDLLLLGGTVVNTLTGELMGADIAIKSDRIVRVGDVSDLLSFSPPQMDCSGSFLLPGLIDSHLHTESSLLTPSHFAQVALTRGTTTVVVDPHEIGNVLGIEGLKLYLDEVRSLPLEFLVEVPSCVPAAPTLETGSHIISSHEYPTLFSLDFFGLAEMMNFPGVIHGEEEVLKKLAYAEAYGKIREGHAPALTGKELQAYLTAGISSDHESFSVEEVVEKLRSGCKIQLREGSFARNLVKLATGIKEKLSSAKNPWDQVIICTDDKHADDLLYSGHLDHSLRLLVNQVGLDPITAIQICTLNPARHLKRDDLGSLAPGNVANIVRVDNLTDFKVLDVVSKGQHVATEGRLLVAIEPVTYPDWALTTVRPKFVPSRDDFHIEAPISDGYIDAHVIGVLEHSLVTDHLVEKVRIQGGRVVLDGSRDLAYYFLLDRHGKTNHFSKSLVHGFKFEKDVAVASTVGHDSHQILIVGNSPDCMEFALTKLMETNGGQIIVKMTDGEFDYRMLPLPYAGLMSLEPPEKVAAMMHEMKRFSAEVCRGISEPFMSLSFMALPVIPKLKLSDLGVVDVDQFKVIDLFVM